MRFLQSVWVVGSFGMMVGACGGSDFQPLGAGGDAATDGSTDAASNATDAAMDASGSTDGSAGDGGATSDSGGAESGGGDAAACPDEHGAYSVQTSGLGCGDLNAAAPQCVKQTGCAITFVSNGSIQGSALNGTASLVMAGDFTGAAIREGTVQRTGCTGTWDSATSTLTVDCGGMGSSQSCVATLVRTAATCP